MKNIGMGAMVLIVSTMVLHAVDMDALKAYKAAHRNAKTLNSQTEPSTGETRIVVIFKTEKEGQFVRFGQVYGVTPLRCLSGRVCLYDTAGAALAPMLETIRASAGEIVSVQPYRSYHFERY